MKKLLVAILAFVSISLPISVSASEETLSNEELFCRGIGILSGNVMAQRQSNVPQENVLNNIKEDFSTDENGNAIEMDEFTHNAIVKITEVAYQAPIVEDEEEKNMYVLGFSKGFYDSCTAELSQSE